MSAKYTPLRDHLSVFAAAGRETVELHFAEIAELVVGLPPTAYTTRQWWGNSDSVQARSWRDADWHVAQVDFGRERVRFERGKVGTALGERRPVRESAAVVLAVETEMSELDVRVHMTWQRAGDVTLDANGELVFPPLPRAPGVYRISMSGAPGQERPYVYVGESDNLRNRPNGYRRPGPTQWTNQRLRGELLEHLGRGGRVTVAVVTTATIDAVGESSELPLIRKSARVLAEHAALTLIYLDGTGIVLNKDKGGGMTL